MFGYGDASVLGSGGSFRLNLLVVALNRPSTLLVDVEPHPDRAGPIVLTACEAWRP
jgi:hypothetical protein